MKSRIEQLFRIARQPDRRIIGLMSGTSLDGLDVALCRFTGAGTGTGVVLEQFATVPYEEREKAEIRKIFAQRSIDFQELVLLNVSVAERHAAIVLHCLANWDLTPEDIDLLASHGQTVYHAPRRLHGLPGRPNATLQIGDGDHLARRTGIITLSDFRQKHLAAGGEGAPLALYGDYFLFSQKGEARYLLNIGGIANFTCLPADGDPSKAFATDTGPGNTLLDALTRTRFGLPFDENAALAGQGRVDETLLARFKSDPFFVQPFPKTTGPEQFSLDWVSHHLSGSAQEKATDSAASKNLLATLTRLSADTIAEALLRHQKAGTEASPHLYVSGGGAHNPLMMKYLREKLLHWNIQPMQVLGVHGDAKEAVLFAALANETVAGNKKEGAMLGGIPLVSMGKISLPE